MVYKLWPGLLQGLLPYVGTMSVYCTLSACVNVIYSVFTHGVHTIFVPVDTTKERTFSDFYLAYTDNVGI